MFSRDVKEELWILVQYSAWLCVSTSLMCDVLTFVSIGLGIFSLAPHFYFRVGKQQDFVKLWQQTSRQRQE